MGSLPSGHVIELEDYSRLTCKLKFDWDSIIWHQKARDHMSSTITPTLSWALWWPISSYFGFFSLNTIFNAPSTWLLIMTCTSAVLSHVISRLVMSCDRISIKLQLTGKFRLIFQFYHISHEYLKKKLTLPTYHYCFHPFLLKRMQKSAEFS